MTRISKASATLASDMMLAPMVIWMRLPLLAAEAQTSTGLPGAETMKAVTEKAAAFAQGLAAAQMSMVGSAMRFWPEILSGKTPSILNGAAVELAMNAAMRPAGRSVRGNFRRLSSR
jgi:hypothetical protein